MKQARLVHAKGGEVGKRDFAEAIANVEDFEGQPRAKLPVAVPVPFAASEAEPELGEPMGIQAVAHLIGCSVWTVRQQCLRQGLPHFRASRSGRLIFYRKQVVRWLIEKQTERR